MALKPQYFPTEELNLKQIADGINSWGVSLEHVKMTYFEMEPNTIFKMDSNTHEQITMVVEGELFLRIGNQEAKVNKGEVFTLPIGVDCIIRTTEQPVKAVDAWVMMGEIEEDENKEKVNE
ncbi:MAG: cupin domain-containing protein [Desulfobulbaceae bacterium]|nr:cupin domain-containing protein [Desulfobulbaceae bacterium]